MENTKLHLDILDEKRKSILPILSSFKGDFYLAGGTALALQIGHRDSIDFDFFTENDFDNLKLKAEVEDLFADHSVNVFQLETNTLSCIIDGEIKLSFFTYKSKLLKPVIESEYFNLASLEDIFCMKLSAICGRSVNKDFFDIYFLLEKITLSEALKMCEEKFPTLNVSVIIKSLVYFDELVVEEIKTFPGFGVDFETIKQTLNSLVKEIKL